MSEAGAKRGGGYIVGRGYDVAFFLAPPVVALGLGIVISGSAFADEPIVLFGESTTSAGFFIGALIHAHLVAVFLRSHANPGIFKRFRLRFLLVPPLVWLAIVLSPWLAIAATVVATFWDVWHSGAQTFGLGRIYDRNAGFPVEEGRRLDFWMNQLLYAGPILAGATLMDHLVVLEDFEIFEDGLSDALVLLPTDLSMRQGALRWGILVGGTIFVIVYLASYWRLHRRGLRPSWQKVWLLASTGLCSIYTWGFNRWGEAFFIMNLFHAVQYLALVWSTEHGRWVTALRLPQGARSEALLLLLFLGGTAAYGVLAEAADPSLDALWALTITVSLMHFWYDGFVWSVRAKQV